MKKINKFINDYLEEHNVIHTVMMTLNVLLINTGDTKEL